MDLESESSCEHMSEINSMWQLSQRLRKDGDNKCSEGGAHRACERGGEKELKERLELDDKALQTL